MITPLFAEAIARGVFLDLFWGRPSVAHEYVVCGCDPSASATCLTDSSPFAFLNSSAMPIKKPPDLNPGSLILRIYAEQRERKQIYATSSGFGRNNSPNVLLTCFRVAALRLSLTFR